ncbi:2-C-methyl-D-erythritol 2,4-cyclodiphosphate synthase [candidate division KSB1 bacterium]
MNVRIGFGKDTHKLVEGRSLTLGGVKIPNDKGLLGHSDADVIVHAIMDSLFGAAALGDIGTHFPDSDPVYKDISSLELLKKTAEIIADNGFSIQNIDCTIILQKPKIAGFINDIRKNIAEVLSIDIKNISIKATTSECLGPEGRGEGATAEAVSLILEK